MFRSRFRFKADRAASNEAFDIFSRASTASTGLFHTRDCRYHGVVRAPGIDNFHSERENFAVGMP